MAVTIINGNIFNSKAQTIVNTVNCVGVMGKGIALVFKLRYPSMFEQYQKYCAQHLIEVGKLWIYKGEETDPWVLNFPTKTHWKLPSEYKNIENSYNISIDKKTANEFIYSHDTKYSSYELKYVKYKLSKYLKE